MARTLPVLLLVVGSLFCFTFPSFGAMDPLSVKEKASNIRDAVIASAKEWYSLISEVSSAQDAGKKPSEYQESYDKLLLARKTLLGYASELSSYQSEIQAYKEAHPELTETEARQLSEALDIIDTVNTLVMTYLMRIADVEARQARLLAEAPPEEKKVEPELSLRGEVSVLTGNGTLTDRDRQYLSLSQRYMNRNENVFTFLERYENDHSFIDKRNIFFGMSQQFPYFLRGELNLRESFLDYDDLTDNSNSRKELTFGFDYSRPFAGDRTQTFFSYQYLSKNYHGVSPRSYLNHRASIELTHELSEKVIGNAYWQMIDSHYALADLNGYNSTYLGAGIQFLPSPNMVWDLKYQSLENSYDVRKTSAYFEEYLLLDARYQPGADSIFEGDLRFLDHNRRRTPTQSYNESRLRLRYGKSFGDTADGDFRFEWRDKSFDIASGDDYNYLRWQAYLNFFPSSALRWYYNFDLYDYNYSSPLRDYRRMYNRLGFSYRFENGALLTSEFALTDQNYSVNTGRNYTITDFLADLYVPVGRRDNFRFFLTLSRLDQSAPASVNDYTARDLGLEFNHRLSDNYRLRFIYTHDRRDYRNQADITDSAFEARLNFEF